MNTPTIPAVTAKIEQIIANKDALVKDRGLLNQAIEQVKQMPTGDREYLSTGISPEQLSECRKLIDQHAKLEKEKQFLNGACESISERLNGMKKPPFLFGKKAWETEKTENESKLSEHRRSLSELKGQIASIEGNVSNCQAMIRQYEQETSEHEKQYEQDQNLFEYTKHKALSFLGYWAYDLDKRHGMRWLERQVRLVEIWSEIALALSFIPEKVTDLMQVSDAISFETLLVRADKNTLEKISDPNLRIILQKMLGKRDQDFHKRCVKLAEEGDPHAQLSLGHSYNHGELVQEDDAEAARWVEKAAEQGDIDGQIQLSNMYFIGQGVQNDFQKAVQWLRKAAEQEDPKSQLTLAMIIGAGAGGVSKDEKEANKWLQKAAEQGEPQAQQLLGSRYYNGIGVEQNFEKAEKWLRRAAEQGHVIAQLALGLMFSEGDGVHEDYFEAEKWWTLADEQGKIAATVLLAHMYQKAPGNFPRDLTKAAKLYRKVAEIGVTKHHSEEEVFGISEARFKLSAFYKGGAGGLSKSDNDFVFWLFNAARLKNPSALKTIGKAQLPPDHLYRLRPDWR